MADKVHDIFYHDCSDTDIADAQAEAYGCSALRFDDKGARDARAIWPHSEGLCRVHRSIRALSDPTP